MIKNQAYIHPDTATSVTTKYVPTRRPSNANWNRMIVATSTAGNTEKKSKEEMEEEQAWKAYQETKTQFYRVFQMLADS